MKYPTTEELNALLDREEPLDPELAEYLAPGPLGPCLKHPLVCQLAYHPTFNAFLNECLSTKKQALLDYLNEEKWEHVIWLHEKPYRFQTFNKYQSNFSDTDYWRILGEIWQDSENLWQHRDLIPTLLWPLNRSLELRSHMMCKEDQEALDALPETLTIYRGCAAENRVGYSWTVNEKKALWFAKRFSRKEPIVLAATVNKSSVVAYFTERQEDEIVVKPEDVIIC